MNLQPTEDQLQIVDAVAAFMAEQLPLSRLRHIAPEADAVTPEQWRQIVELGWLGLGLAEDHGGLGCTVVEEVLMFREFGRQVGPLDLLGSVLGARVAAHAGARDVLDQILSGSARVALALPTSRPVRAASRLDGAVQLFGARSATYALLVDEGGAVLTTTAGVALNHLPCIERPLSLAAAELQARPVVAFVDASTDPVDARMALLVSAMQVGVAEGARDMAVAYAKERKQFGQPIGSFQAIKHLCSDMAVRCEEAAGQLFYAALSLRDRTADPAIEVPAATFIAARAALENVASCIQVHGGIGMTAELDAHWLLKRAHVLDQVVGNSRRRLEQLIAEGS